MGRLKATVTDAPAEAALIVFGLDDSEKGHASWFGQAEAEAAVRAAGFMNMRVLPVTTPEHHAIALEIAPGRLFESGRGFVPYCKIGVLERLSAFPEAYQAPTPAIEEAALGEPLPAITSTPGQWLDIAPGGLVLAAEEDAAGWYEAVVSEAKDEGLFVLRWRDWPEVAAFVRRREDLALIYAAAADAA